MSLEKSAPEGLGELMEPLGDGRFRFACHPGVPCFNECCRDLTLLLTPYDLLRLEQCLSLESGELLDRYTEARPDERRGLPMVYLRMDENEEKTCPYLSPRGCSVYAHRPSACRTYPLARASRSHRVHGTVLENYFVLREKHCRGFEEDRSFSAEEWIRDQGLEPYHEMNNAWMEIVTDSRLHGGLPMRQQQMFYMASYDLDRFREFVFGSRFLQLFELGPGEADSAKENGEELLRLALRWLRFSLLNEGPLKVRKEVEERYKGGTR